MANVTLDFAAGSLTAIIGPNGAGKTTFFNLISGAMRPDRGTVKLAGEDIGGLSPPQIVRRGVARAFQIANIFPSLTVEAILTATVQAHLGYAERITRRFPLPECRDRAFDVMTMLGLSDKATLLSSSLSHGDQKLLDIGLALVLEPRVLLLDEPTAGIGAGKTLADDRQGPGIVGAAEDDAGVHRARHGYRLQDRPIDPRSLLRPGARGRDAKSNPRQSGGDCRLSRHQPRNA